MQLKALSNYLAIISLMTFAVSSHAEGQDVKQNLYKSKLDELREAVNGRNLDAVGKAIKKLIIIKESKVRQLSSGPLIYGTESKALDFQPYVTNLHLDLIADALVMYDTKDAGSVLRSNLNDHLMMLTTRDFKLVDGMIEETPIKSALARMQETFNHVSQVALEAGNLVMDKLTTTTVEKTRNFMDHADRFLKSIHKTEL